MPVRQTVLILTFGLCLAVIGVGCGNKNARSPEMTHDEKPQQSTGKNKDIEAEVAEIMASSYVESVRPLNGKLQDRVIRTSQGGRTGYILWFDDGSYLVAYLADSQLRWKVGTGDPSPVDASLIHSPQHPDVSGPQKVERPYADEKSDIASEVAKAHGKTVKGIAVGKDTFNLCFSDGHEIDATLMPSADGRKGLRVFWEQW
jgi:hypothetical protein